MTKQKNEIISVHFDYLPNGNVQMMIEDHESETIYMYKKPIVIGKTDFNEFADFIKSNLLNVYNKQKQKRS